MDINGKLELVIEVRRTKEFVPLCFVQVLSVNVIIYSRANRKRADNFVDIPYPTVVKVVKT